MSYQSYYKKNKMFLHLLLPTISILPIIIISFTILYFFDIPSFISMSKITIFCMAFYLVINAFNTMTISSNLLLSSISLFYGAINLLQVAHIVCGQFFKLLPGSPVLSLKVYYLGRFFFATALIILVILYKYRPQWISKLSIIGILILSSLFFMVINIDNDLALTFIKGNSFGSYALRIGDKFYMIAAMLFGIRMVYPLRKQIPQSHLIIFGSFCACAFTMETLNIINFLPFGSTRSPYLPHIFKLTTLFIFIIGQVDCCILRPFANLYMHRSQHKQQLNDAFEELYRYSDYVAELENALACKASSIHQLISIFPEPVLICHQDRIINANQSALSLLGVKQIIQLQTSSILDYIQDDSLDLLESLKSLHTINHANTIIQSEGLLISPIGQHYDVEYIFASTSLFDEHSTICILRDISAKKVSQLAEKHLHEQEFKLSYLSNLSHDLKAPLNVIYSALQMQERTTILEESHRYTYMMQQNTLKLLRMITNLLDLNKASQNMITLKPQLINIVDKVEEICEMSSSYIEGRQLTYLFDTSIEEKFVSIDIQLLERILLNLISNAIKYTPSGGQLFFEIHDTADSVTIHIRDTGIGISPQQLPFIFKRFTVGDRSASGSAPSLYDKSYGMGLSIVNELVSLIGGTIVCHSVLDQGTEFILTIPTPSIDEALPTLTENNFSPINLKMEFYDI